MGGMNGCDGGGGDGGEGDGMETAEKFRGVDFSSVEWRSVSVAGHLIFAGGGADESPSSSTGIGETTGVFFDFEMKKRGVKTGGGSRPMRGMLFRVCIMIGGVGDREGKDEAAVRAFTTDGEPACCGTSLDAGEDDPWDAAIAATTTDREGVGLGASMTGSDMARGGASIYGNMDPCRNVSGTACETGCKVCSGPFLGAHGADGADGGGGGGATRVGLGGDTVDEDGDEGCGNAEARGDGPEAT